MQIQLASIHMRPRAAMQILRAVLLPVHRSWPACGQFAATLLSWPTCGNMSATSEWQVQVGKEGRNHVGSGQLKGCLAKLCPLLAFHQPAETLFWSCSSAWWFGKAKVDTEGIISGVSSFCPPYCVQRYLKCHLQGPCSHDTPPAAEIEAVTVRFSSFSWYIICVSWGYYWWLCSPECGFAELVLPA